jgi:hypothetical protein
MSARGIPEYAFNLQLAREIKQALIDGAPLFQPGYTAGSGIGLTVFCRGQPRCEGEGPTGCAKIPAIGTGGDRSAAIAVRRGCAWPPREGRSTQATVITAM